MSLLTTDIVTKPLYRNLDVDFGLRSNYKTRQEKLPETPKRTHRLLGDISGVVNHYSVCVYEQSVNESLGMSIGQCL